MKQIFLFFFLLAALNSYSQSEIMDSVKRIQTNNDYELAKSFCTSGYWNADSDGGINTFKQISGWGEGVELKLSNKTLKDAGAILTVDLYFEGIPRDRVYFYMLKDKNKWFIDGINEIEYMHEYFLSGQYSGHFSPSSLPADKELADFGNKILSFERDEYEMQKFLEENTAPGSELDFTSQMTTDLDFELHYVNSVGYEERSNLGFINFKGKHVSEEDYYSSITIYVTKNVNGKIKILDREYHGGPYARSFFYNLKKLSK
jgi:hypothetical protein